jgi:hypothetical protein
MERASLDNRWAYGRPHQPFVTRRKRRWSGVAALTALFTLGAAALAYASDINVAVVDTTAPTGSVTLAPGGNGSITINMSVTGNQAGTATFEVNRNWSLSGGAFTGSNPQEFTVAPRSGGDPATTFSTTGTVSVAAGQADGTFTLAVGAFDITNSNATGAKLAAGTSSNYQVTVEAPSGPTLTAPVLALPGNISVLATSAAGAVVTYSASASDENGAVAINCSPVSGSTFAPGTTTVNCSATNAAGTTNGSFTVTVSFGFVGFDRPVDNDGVLNVAKAGQAIPLKFQVTGAGGAGISGLTAPPVKVTVANLSCGLDATPDQLEEYAAGSSGLQDLGGGYYQFNWKTPKDYAGSCKTMKVDLGDAISHTALFKFTK